MRAPLSVRNRRATLLVTCGLLCLGPGACDRDRDRDKDTASAPFPASRSVERTSYEVVTSRLDRGGRVFAYWSTESWLEDLSDGVDEWKEAVLEWRALPSPQRVRIERTFNVAGRLIRNSGLEQISGVGLSTIALEPDLYHTRAMLHHHPGNDRGYLWSLFGKSAHPLQALDLLPADTALAVVTDLNLPLLWAAVEQELTQINLPETREWVRRFPARFEERTGLKFYRMLASLDGECGLILTLDSERSFTMPLPSGEALTLPEPGLVLMVRVKDDTLFNRVSDWLASGEHAGGSETNAIRRLSLPAPDSPLPLTPALVRSGNYLLLASTGRMMDEVLAVQSGARPGLKHSEEFRRLSLRVPTEGNRFTFVSRRLGDSLGALEDRMMTGPNTRAAERRLLRGFLNPDQLSGSWSVWSRVEQGWLRVGNSNRDITADAMTSLGAMPVGLLLGITLPNFIQARETAQYNSIMNNLRRIQAAKEQWALENRKPEGTPVTQSDLADYLRGGWVSPAFGETYQIHPVGTPPAAVTPQSIRNHPAGEAIRLPQP